MKDEVVGLRLIKCLYNLSIIIILKRKEENKDVIVETCSLLRRFKKSKRIWI